MEKRELTFRQTLDDSSPGSSGPGGDGSSVRDSMDQRAWESTFQGPGEDRERRPQERIIAGTFDPFPNYPLSTYQVSDPGLDGGHRDGGWISKRMSESIVSELGPE